MVALEQLELAEQHLGRLHTELQQTEQLAARTENAVHVKELARVRRNGGAIFYNAGTLRTQQIANQKLRVLRAELEQQEVRVESCRAAVARDEINRLHDQRDQVLQHMRESFGQLTAQLQQLGHLREVAASINADTAEFDPRRLLITQSPTNVFKLPLTQNIERAAQRFVAELLNDGDSQSSGGYQNRAA